MSGSLVRLGRLFPKSSSRSFCIAIDHGLALGVPQGAENAVATVERVVESGPDGVLISPGLLGLTARAFAHRGAPVAILRVDMWSQHKWVRRELDQYRLIADPEDAVRLGADALAVLLVLGSPDPVYADNAAAVARLAERAHRVGLPLMVEVVAWGQYAEKYEHAGLLTYGCRVAAELGADLIKVPFTGTIASMRELIAGCPVPVLVLGGPRADSDDDVLESARQALESGARGLVYGRNVWQAPDPLALVRSLRALLEAGIQ